MVINYCGGSCFKIQSGKLSIITDPLPRFKGDIVLLLTTEKSDWPPTPGHIYGPGEYEMLGVEIRGIPAKDKTSTYILAPEEIQVAFLGETGENLEPGVLDKIGEVDILFVPAKTSAKVIKQLQPKIVIPFYKRSDELKEFLKEMDQKPAPEEKLTIKKKEIETGKTKVVVLEPSNA